ncbi:Asp-tRNA(Asn)/Glu-tRNA(Gln) amidotransferase subunit GatC [Gammaproteobacteria bacterium]|jgi:aspartyl-tRNA(Asn)/glutamyl-tRNA(Gln) amidotransferase subunit C|nr:Asp-tRNA(Asn)/Glu-tRNA(Gln) amidotransferase subunit GatC [Gammaproteobacteria bacterium]|tara:strand:- start:107 stop:388 length:282 start_codon:yes stop_codon:yes gene_type:complete
MDKKTVTTISYLSRLKIDDQKEEKIIEDLDNIIKFVDQLNIIDTSDVAPLTNPLEKTAKTRKDIVTAKNLKKDLLEVAPSSNDDYFLVPRVVE